MAVAVRDSAGSGSLNYLLGDQLGSTTVSVNSSTGAVATQRYLPYGAIRSSSGTQATDRGFIGQTKDGSTGLQYLNARYYDPAVGRFTAIDPLADLNQPGSLDGYGYAGGSPVTAKDPTGLLCESDNPCGRKPGTGKPRCIGSCTGPPPGSGGGGGGGSTSGGSSGGAPPKGQFSDDGNHVYDSFEDAIFYWATWFNISPTLLGTTLEHEGYGSWQGYTVPLYGKLWRLAEYEAPYEAMSSVGIGGMDPKTAVALGEYYNFAPHTEDEMRMRLTFNDDDAVMFAAGKLSKDQKLYDLTDRETFQAYAYSDTAVGQLAERGFESKAESASRGERWDQLSPEVGNHLNEPG